MLKRIRKTDPFPIVLILAMVSMWMVLDALTGKRFFGSTPYNSYTLQALSWLNGHTWVENDPILELAIFGERYYVSFPPLPSVILLPFAAIFGEAVPDNLMVKVYGCAAVLFLYRALKNVSLHRADAALWSFLAVFSSSLLPLTLEGAVWYQAQTLAVMLLTGSLYFLTVDRMTPSLLLYALSVACRPFDALWFFPLTTVWAVLYLRAKVPVRELIRKLLPGIGAGLAVAAAIGIYNFVRFGDPLEFGHNHLPEFSFQGGVQFSLSHIPNNVRTFVLGLPFDMTEQGFSLKLFGFSFLIACPALTLMLLHVLADLFKKRMDVMRAVTVIVFLVHLCLLLMHRTFGGYQFGARYCADLLPYAFLYRLLQRERKKTPLWELIVLGIGWLFTLYGSVMIHL